MAYLGKEYKMVKGENFEAFAESLKVIGMPAELVGHYNKEMPTSKVEKNGDEYTFTTTTPEKTSTASFKSGVEFEQEVVPGVKLFTVYTVDGNTISQIVKRTQDDDKFLTLKREYDGDKLTMTVTNNFWDGAYTRYYSA